jgi:hypothetical protein
VRVQTRALRGGENCNRSAAAASSSLAPTGIRIPDEPNMLIPTPATGSTSTQALANRTGSSSGPVISAGPTAVYASVNSSAIVMVMPFRSDPDPPPWSIADSVTPDLPTGCLLHVDELRG